MRSSRTPDHKKTITLLGSTGSIGKQTVEAAENLGYRISGICAGRNITELEAQIRRLSPVYCAVYDPKAYGDLKIRVADTPVKVLCGLDGVLEMCGEDKSDILLNSLLGSVGILPTLRAIESGKDIAMANKEPIVAAGDFILSEAKKRGVRIIPVDSEHSAIFQCISGGFNAGKYVKKLILTASGGPFYGKNADELKNVTWRDAVKHPTWSMGKKISVDSATLMNKGLELIEAVRLFGVDQKNVDITVHRQSVIHSMVEFCDGSVLAQMGIPDMRRCIHFALTYPERVSDNGLCEPLDFSKSLQLTFSPVDEETFSLVALARKAVSGASGACAVINAANEAAVSLFLDEKIGFTDIFSLVHAAYGEYGSADACSLDDVFALEEASKRFVFSRAEKAGRMDF